MKTEKFTDGQEYAFRLEQLVVEGYNILCHGYNDGIYWIRYYVKEYKYTPSEWC